MTSKTNAQNQAAYRSRQRALRKNLEDIVLKLRVDFEILRNDLRKISRALARIDNPSFLLTLDSLPLSKTNAGARVYDPRFVRWFQGYPEKVGKGAAEVAFLKALKKGATEDALLDGVERYIAHKPVDRPWCNPATWLNQERWNDEYTTNGSGVLSEPRGPRSPPPTLQDLGLEE